MILIITLTACSHQNELLIEDDDRITPLQERLKDAYGYEAENIRIIMVNPSDNYDVLLFTFNHENTSYIGDSGFRQKTGVLKTYSIENLHYLNIHQIQDLDIPFTIMSSMSSMAPSSSEAVIDYNFYYGWINDENITEIVIDFGDASMYIKLVSGKYYSALRLNHKLIKTIRGLDDEKNTVYEIKLSN